MRKLWILAVLCALFSISSVTAQNCKVRKGPYYPYGQDVFKVYEYNGTLYEGG